MRKAELRNRYKQKRLALSSDEAIILSHQIFQQFKAYFSLKSVEAVHVFITLEKFREVETEFLINYFFEKNIRVFVPRMNGENLENIEIFPDTEFKLNEWGIEEPVGKASEDIHFNYVLVPLLYCDHFGNRIGYGKGFYDRLFEKINTDAKKIGINYFEPNETIDDVSPCDVPLDYLVTSCEVLSFTGC